MNRFWTTLAAFEWKFYGMIASRLGSGLGPCEISPRKSLAESCQSCQSCQDFSNSLCFTAFRQISGNFGNFWDTEKVAKVARIYKIHCILQHLGRFRATLATLASFWIEILWRGSLQAGVRVLTTTTESSKSTIHDYVRPRLHDSRLPHAHDHDCSDQVHDSRSRLVSDL